MIATESKQCPICKVDYNRSERVGMDAQRINCGRCGTYEIASLGVMSLQEHSDLLPYLSAHTRQAWEFENRVVRLDPRTWPELAEMHRHTSVHQKAEKLLRLIEKRTQHVGQYIAI